MYVFRSVREFRKFIRKNYKKFHFNKVRVKPTKRNIENLFNMYANSRSKLLRKIFVDPCSFGIYFDHIYHRLCESYLFGIFYNKTVNYYFRSYLSNDKFHYAILSLEDLSPDFPLRNLIGQLITVKDQHGIWKVVAINRFSCCFPTYPFLRYYYTELATSKEGIGIIYTRHRDDFLSVTKCFNTFPLKIQINAIDDDQYCYYKYAGEIL